VTLDPFMRSKIEPFGYLKPSTVSHSVISAVVGLWSRPFEEAPCRKNRLGHVGPGIDEYHWSQSTYSVASWYSTGSWEAVSKHCMISPTSAGGGVGPSVVVVA
jgi:hypothetical protein